MSITNFKADYAGMPSPARRAMLADLERHYANWLYACLPFDPTELVEEARTQYPKRPELALALSACTTEWRENALYSYFMDPADRAARWQIGCSIQLHSRRHGELVIDVMRDGSIGGIEFLDQVMGASEKPAPPPTLRVVHRK